MSLLTIGFIIFIVLLVIGAPIWLSLGLSGFFWLFVQLGMPTESISSQFFIATDSWLLLAIPYFLLAGNLMTFMGPATKLFTFIANLVGHLPGGLTSAAVVTAAVFGALSGSVIATVIAVGSMVIPQMLKMGYSKQSALGVVAASGTLGQMIPPSIFMIIYASMTQIDAGQLFLAGIVPGIFMAIVLIIVAIIVSYKDKTERPKRASFKDVSISFIHAIPALLMPVIILGGIYGGVFTPTESAAIAVLFVLIISFFFNRSEFTKENIKRSLVSSMITTTVIYIILGGAQLFSTALTYTQFPQKMTEYIANMTTQGWMIMWLILILFFVLGTFLEPLPILFITMPILYPIVLDLGYDPIHFGIVTCALMMISQITPPVGGSLFALSGHFKEDVILVSRGSVPYLYGLIVASIVLLYVPWLSTFLFK